MTAFLSLLMNKLTVLRWAAVIVVLQILYLVMELAFNARLVDSITVADTSYFEYLAHVGRVLSGAGCTLVGFSLLRKWNTRSMHLWVSAHFMLAIMIFPAVYYGQEMIINKLVKSSTAEQRAHAQYIALLKRGLANNAVVFKDIEFTPEDIERPEAKTFINTIGFAVFFAPDFIQSVAESSDQILRHLAIRQSTDNLPDAYKNYLDARVEIEKLSVLYNEANTAFEEKAKTARLQAREIWSEVFVGLQEKWEHVRSDPRREELKYEFENLYNGLELYAINKKACTENVREIFQAKCMQELNKTYAAAASKPVPPEYWCKPLPVKNSWVSRNSKLVKIDHAEEFDCTNRDFIQTQFLKLQGVSALEYESFEAFMASGEVAHEIRESLAKQGINMPEKYRIVSHEGFVKGVEFELTKKLTAAFSESSIKEFGVAIPPRLSSKDFIQHAVVQNPLRKALGLDASAGPVAVDLSQRAFLDEILVPRLQVELSKERARLLAKTAFFADGEPYAEDGKVYVRSVLVPPVAMGLSLFFGLLNLASLGATLLSKLKLSAIAVSLCKLGFVLVLVLGPLIISSQIAQTEPFQRIVDETQASLGAGRYFVVWLTSLQPLVYPLGSGLADLFNLFEYQ